MKPPAPPLRPRRLGFAAGSASPSAVRLAPPSSWLARPGAVSRPPVPRRGQTLAAPPGFLCVRSLYSQNLQLMDDGVTQVDTPG